MIGSEAPLKCSQRYSRLIIIRFLYKLIIAGLGGPTAYSPAEGEIPKHLFLLLRGRVSPLSTTTSSSRLSLTLSTEATTVTRQTSNKHMSVCPSFTVSRRFLIQRELNKSQLLYMQVYLYISIIMASIQTRSLASASGSVHGCKLGPE